MSATKELRSVVDALRAELANIRLRSEEVQSALPGAVTQLVIALDAECAGDRTVCGFTLPWTGGKPECKRPLGHEDEHHTNPLGRGHGGIVHSRHWDKHWLEALDTKEES